ncbi:hypothetical protein PAXINDRAFT_24420, partial [Paxillus involutus ATCC 200175]
TVYEGELVGMILATELLKGERNVKSVSLGLDNKAAIQATTAFKSGPGHYLMDIFHDNLRKALLHHKLGQMRIRWTPGHIGIPGNEEADEEAREAVK